MSAAEVDAAPPPAVAPTVALESFDAWASRHRRRAAHEGAWRVEVSEQVMRSAVRRSVTTWHDNAPQPPLPPRKSQQRQRVVQPQQKQPSRRAMGSQMPRQPNKKQQRSALRSAAHHRALRLRALRRVQLVVLFYVRLWRAMMTTLALRDASSARRACGRVAGLTRQAPPLRRVARRRDSACSGRRGVAAAAEARRAFGATCSCRPPARVSPAVAAAERSMPAIARCAHEPRVWRPRFVCRCPPASTGALTTVRVPARPRPCVRRRGMRVRQSCIGCHCDTQCVAVSVSNVGYVCTASGRAPSLPLVDR